MNYGPRLEHAPEHPEIAALLPWYVNGSIADIQRQRVDSHLRNCAICRGELLLEQEIYQGMTAEASVEYMPVASLKRLQARLDGLDEAAPPSVRSLRRPIPWQALKAASIAVIAVALGLLAADKWIQLRALRAADYYTVTTPTPRPPGEVIRAVFSPTITLVEMQAILDEAQLRIVSGPTEAGVYSLAAKSGRPVSTSLAQLRRHAKVRFAESTQPAGAGDPP